MFLIVYDYFWFFSLSIASQYFHYIELNTKIRKSVFCFVATLLSGATTYSHYDILFLGAPNVTSNIIDLTNSYMRMYLLTDLVSVLRDKIIRKDMVFHHILMLYFFTNDFKVYTAYYTMGEILSIWYLFTDNEKLICLLRLLSIFPIRFINMFLSTFYFLRYTDLSQHEINGMLLLIIMLPLDMWWFYGNYKRYVELKNK